jgi:MYXO-CTERM domain-containing protein
MPIEDAIARSTAIFEGRVETIEGHGGPLEVTFAVTQAWGGVDHEHVEVRTDAAGCGFPFEVGGRYLVFATGEPGLLEVSLCSHTARIEDAGTDRAALGAGVIPVDVVDETVDPVRPPRTEAPGRGGCASCAASAGTPIPGWLWALGLVLLTRRRKTGLD